MSQVPAKTIHKLTMPQQFELINFVKAGYEMSGMTDAAFAEKASNDLGFHVTAGNVQGVRQQFGIEANRLRAAREARENGTGSCDAGLIAARVEELSERIARLALVLERLIDRVGEVEQRLPPKGKVV